MHRFKELTVHEYNKTEQKWTSFEWNELRDSKTEMTKVRIVCFNVATDTFVKKKPMSHENHKQCHKQRQAATIKLLHNENADVIGLNEVTDTLITSILKEDWVRDSYQISRLQNEDIAAFGNIILSRIPIKRAHTIKLISEIKRQPDCIEIIINNKTFLITNAHLSAHGCNRDQRRAELQGLAEGDDHILSDVSVIMGDLNLHRERENIAIPSNYTDSWLAIRRSPDNGYTFDSLRNKMILEMFPHFKMTSDIRVRPDRILLSEKSQSGEIINLHNSSISLFADSPIYPDVCNNKTKKPLYQKIGSLPFSALRAAVSSAGDLVGTNILRDPREYLYPSDHFGLTAEFALNILSKEY